MNEMDVNLLAKIAENKRKALERKALRASQSPEANRTAAKQGQKSSSLPTTPSTSKLREQQRRSPSKTPALTDAILALASEFTAFREQVSRKHRRESSDGELEVDGGVGGGGMAEATTPVVRNKTRRSQSKKARLEFGETAVSSGGEGMTVGGVIPQKDAALQNEVQEIPSPVLSQNDTLFTASFLDNIPTTPKPHSSNDKASERTEPTLTQELANQLPLTEKPPTASTVITENRNGQLDGPTLTQQLAQDLPDSQPSRGVQKPGPPPNLTTGQNQLEIPSLTQQLAQDLPDSQPKTPTTSNLSSKSQERLSSSKPIEITVPNSVVSPSENSIEGLSLPSEFSSQKNDDIDDDLRDLSSLSSINSQAELIQPAQAEQVETGKEVILVASDSDDFCDLLPSELSPCVQSDRVVDTVNQRIFVPAQPSTAQEKPNETEHYLPPTPVGSQFVQTYTKPAAPISPELRRTIEANRQRALERRRQRENNDK